MSYKLLVFGQIQEILSKIPVVNEHLKNISGIFNFFEVPDPCWVINKRNSVLIHLINIHIVRFCKCLFHLQLHQLSKKVLLMLFLWRDIKIINFLSSLRHKIFKFPTLIKIIIWHHQRCQAIKETHRRRNFLWWELMTARSMDVDENAYDLRLNISPISFCQKKRLSDFKRKKSSRQQGFHISAFDNSIARTPDCLISIDLNRKC